jgi:hypothetical protein
MAISLIETASLDTGLVAPTATALTTASGSAPSYSARAWVNFNGTGTVAIRASGNVSSITDNGTGDYTVNFTTAMSDANYSAAGAVRQNDSGGAQVMRVMSINAAGLLSAAMATTSLRVSTCFQNGGLEDSQVVCVSVFR